MEKEKFGQYMTPKTIADFMVSLISKDKKAKVLEPSSGEGIFLDVLKEKGFNDVSGYEIDPEIIKHKNVKLGSFISAELESEFDVIIGNPPYIRWKNLEEELKEELKGSKYWGKYLNALSDYSAVFILKSIELLKDGGELIFITSDYWTNTTHSNKLRDFIVENGSISEMYMFKETPIFKDVTVSLMVFKFVKNIKIKETKVIQYEDRSSLDENILKIMKEVDGPDNINQRFQVLYINNFEVGKPWVLAKKNELELIEKFKEKCSIHVDLMTQKLQTFNDFCEIGNGMVSGLDKAFQINDNSLTDDEIENTIKVIKAKDLEQYVFNDTTKYIYLNDLEMNETEFRNKFPNFYRNLLPYKNQLMERYSYNREIPYWHWVFLRNMELFKNHNRKIFIPCKERISHKDYVRFALVEGDYYPTQDVTAIIPKKDTNESIEYIIALLNSKYVFNWLMFKGIVKGNIIEFSRKPISEIPYRTINFNDENEKKIHNEITDLVQEYVTNRNKDNIVEIEKLIDQLF